MQKIIIVIDIQKEYNTEGRAFFIPHIAASLSKAQSVITAARANNIPVWHVQHKKEGEYFSKDSPLVDFISGFEPLANEKVFIKNKYSCFSSNDFTREITAAQPKEIIVLGYGSSMCCLCTIIEGIHRDFQFTLVEDATASRSFPYASNEEMHHSALNILKQYAKVETADTVIANLTTR